MTYCTIHIRILWLKILKHLTKRSEKNTHTHTHTRMYFYTVQTISYTNLLSQKTFCTFQKHFSLIYKKLSSWAPTFFPHKVIIYWYYYPWGDIWYQINNVANDKYTQKLKKNMYQDKKINIEKSCISKRVNRLWNIKVHQCI